MTQFNGSMPGVAAGNDYDVKRGVSNIPAGQTLTKAWLTCKAKIGDADPGLLQKVITPAAVAGVGQITDTGVSGTGQVLFQLTNVDTLALPVNTLTPYDIQVLTSAGKVYTVEEGMYLSTARVTNAVS